MEGRAGGDEMLGMGEWEQGEIGNKRGWGMRSCSTRTRRSFIPPDTKEDVIIGPGPFKDLIDNGL